MKKVIFFIILFVFAFSIQASSLSSSSVARATKSSAARAAESNAARAAIKSKAAKAAIKSCAVKAAIKSKATKVVVKSSAAKAAVNAAGKKSKSEIEVEQAIYESLMAKKDILMAKEDALKRESKKVEDEIESSVYYKQLESTKHGRFTFKEIVSKIMEVPYHINPNEEGISVIVEILISWNRERYSLLLYPSDSSLTLVQKLFPLIKEGMEQRKMALFVKNGKGEQIVFDAKKTTIKDLNLRQGSTIYLTVLRIEDITTYALWNKIYQIQMEK